MNHGKDCDCPIHIVEDTTKVKYAAWAVIIFFVGLFLITSCKTADTKPDALDRIERYPKGK